MRKLSSASGRTPILLALVVLGVLAMACGTSTSFTVTLKESNVLQIIQTALDIAGVDLPLEISDIAIEDGYIRVTGSYTDEDGQTASGTVDMNLGTRDGEIVAQIVNADFSGEDPSTEQIAEFNQILSREFNEAATSVPGVEIESVSTVKDAVRIRVRLGLGD